MTLQLIIYKNKKQQKLDSVLDGLNEKYGYNFVKRAGKMNVDKKIFDNFPEFSFEMQQKF